jgi:Tfp pilus assembly protein PilF
MSVILDALKKAQDERKRPVYRNGGGDEGLPKKTRWVFYVIVGTLACAILFVLFLPNLYRMQAPSPPQVAQQKEAPVPSVVPPKVVPEAPPSRPPETPAKEDFPKFAAATPQDARRADVTERSQPEKEARRKAPDQRMRLANKEPGKEVKKESDAEPQKPAPIPGKAPETAAPGAPSPEPAVVVQRMTNDRVLTNYNNAILAAEQGSDEQAKKLYLAVLADEPNNIEALNNLGVLAMSEGNTKEAASYFRRILDYRKDYAKAYNNLGLVAVRDGDKKLAEEYFRKAIEVAPQGVEPYLNLAALLRSEKKLEEANSVIDAPLRRGLRGDQLFLSAALIKDELGHQEEAIRYYRYYLQASSPKEDRRKVIERLTFLEESKSAADH